MSSPSTDGNEKRERRSPVRRSRSQAARTPERLGDGPIYAEALGHMQEGRWEQARQSLAQLRSHDPAAEQVERLQGLFDLRLSAEETWAEGNNRPRGPWLRQQAIRVLLIANAAVYLLLAVLWLSAGRASLSP